MIHEKLVQELFVRPLVWIERDANRLGVILYVAIGRILRGRMVRVSGCASRIPHHRFDNALFRVKVALRSPKSSHGGLKGRMNIFGCWQERTDLSSFGFLCFDHVVVVVVLCGFHDDRAPSQRCAFVVAISGLVLFEFCDYALRNSRLEILAVFVKEEDEGFAPLDEQNRCCCGCHQQSRIGHRQGGTALHQFFIRATSNVSQSLLSHQSKRQARLGATLAVPCGIMILTNSAYWYVAICDRVMRV